MKNKRPIIVLSCIFGAILLLILLCVIFNKEEEMKLPDKNPIVTMEIEDYGEIEIELYPEFAFNTVASFVNLIETGFFDGNVINRVQVGFVVQAGGLKDAPYTIKGEFSQNGYDKNTLSHTEGVVSMARSQDPDSAGGQFFIVLDDSAKYSLDGAYAGFGKVIKGMDIIHKIEANDTYEYEEGLESMGFLAENDYITITSAKVQTYGFEYKVEKN